MHARIENGLYYISSSGAMVFLFFAGRFITIFVFLSQVADSDIKAMLTAFDDKDTTFGTGLNIGGQNYEVHR